VIFLHAWLGQNQNQLSELLWVTLSMLALFFLILLINLLTYPRLQIYETRPRPYDSEEGQRSPSLSILVPARNEEHCIETCVRSLVAQDYDELEVLVLDDQSTDSTAEIVRRLIDELPVEQSERLHLLRGEALPPGWIGKISPVINWHYRLKESYCTSRMRIPFMPPAQSRLWCQVCTITRCNYCRHILSTCLAAWVDACLYLC